MGRARYALILAPCVPLGLRAVTCSFVPFLSIRGKNIYLFNNTDQNLVFMLNKSFK